MTAADGAAASAWTHDVTRQAAQLLGLPDLELVPDVEHLRARGTVRVFRVRGLVVRVDEDPRGEALAGTVLVHEALASATSPPLAAGVRARGTLGPMPARGSSATTAPAQGAHPFLVVDWLAGEALNEQRAAGRARDAGTAFARLHAARVMDLFGRLRRARPLTLLASYRRTVETLRGVAAAREQMGRRQDALAGLLAEVQDVVRARCLEREHLFLVARRRVLCHGSPAPARLVAPVGAGSPALQFVGLDEACLGDGAEDLARYAIAARLDPSAEAALLRAYDEELHACGRPDPRLRARYAARRILSLLAEPVAMLAEALLLDGSSPRRPRSGTELDGRRRELAAAEERVSERLLEVRAALCEPDAASGVPGA